MIPILMMYQISRAFLSGRDLRSALFEPKGRWARKDTAGEERTNSQEHAISPVALGSASPDLQCEISELHYGERRQCEEFGPSLQREILSLEMQHDPKRLQSVCQTHYDREKQFNSSLACGVTDQKAVAATNLFFFKILGTNDTTQGAFLETSRIYCCEEIVNF